uniref:Uncharacterized protein n=1 Tax=Timema cristinae TaxID=61476 RepID=A0A7R9CF58_TIMCR|nr:unnamed protein product [Timema cristinae]
MTTEEEVTPEWLLLLENRRKRKDTKLLEQIHSKYEYASDSGEPHSSKSTSLPIQPQSQTLAASGSGKQYSRTSLVRPRLIRRAGRFDHSSRECMHILVDDWLTIVDVPLFTSQLFCCLSELASSI